MSVQTYWLTVAPTLMFALSGVIWVGLWITAYRTKQRAAVEEIKRIHHV
jgi:hypothetical protein